MGALCVAKGTSFLQAENKGLIILWECADWFESLQYMYTNLYLMLDTGSHMS